MSVVQCRNANTSALNEIEESIKEHYVILWSLAKEINMSNPIATIKMDTNTMLDGIPTSQDSKFS